MLSQIAYVLLVLLWKYCQREVFALLQQFVGVTTFVYENRGNGFSSEGTQCAHGQKHGIGLFLVVHCQNYPVLIQIDRIDTDLIGLDFFPFPITFDVLCCY